MANAFLPPRGVYAITTDEPRPLDIGLAAARHALAAGATVLQYRRKRAPWTERLAEAAALRALCAEWGACFIVNDDIDLARASGAHGVHLGREDSDYRPLARESGRRLLVGVSCYRSLEAAREAAAAGADYVAFGSFFPSVTKPHAPPCPLEVLAEARRALAVPIVAIGGITPENGRGLLEAGADFLAVISGIFEQPDIFEATARYRRLFESTS